MKYSFVFLFIMLIVNQSFADIGATNGVANPATCDSGALDTDSGGAALEAQYNPETINLKWYDGNTLMNVTSTSSDTCTYDAGISLPNNPTKTGFTFKGWKVRPEMDFSTLPTNEQGTNRYGIGKKQNKDADACIDEVSTGSREVACNSDFADLTRYEWKTPFSWGTVYGMSVCTDTNDGKTIYQIGNPGTTAGQYCWCKLTGYTPINSSTKYAPYPATSYWFFADKNDVVNCRFICANHCALGVKNQPSHTLGN